MPGLGAVPFGDGGDDDGAGDLVELAELRVGDVVEDAGEFVAGVAQFLDCLHLVGRTLLGVLAGLSPELGVVGFLELLDFSLQFLQFFCGFVPVVVYISRLLLNPLMVYDQR